MFLLSGEISCNSFQSLPCTFEDVARHEEFSILLNNGFSSFNAALSIDFAILPININVILA